LFSYNAFTCSSSSSDRTIPPSSEEVEVEGGYIFEP